MLPSSLLKLVIVLQEKHVIVRKLPGAIIERHTPFHMAGVGLECVQRLTAFHEQSSIITNSRQAAAIRDEEGPLPCSGGIDGINYCVIANIVERAAPGRKVNGAICDQDVFDLSVSVQLMLPLDASVPTVQREKCACF